MARPSRPSLSPPRGLAAAGFCALLAALLTRCGGDPRASGGAAADASAGGAGIGGGGASGSGGVSGAGGFIVTDAGAGGAAPGGGGSEGDAGALPFCGDGRIDLANETCDDGDDVPGDGCSSACRIEANHVCPEEGQPCRSTVECGDGRIGGEEQCDDGGMADDDGCTSTCQLQVGWACPIVGIRCVAAACGDGIVAGFEECDDLNDTPTDGCDGACLLEEGFHCPVAGVACERTTCRDGRREGTEQCDDGNFDLGDGCTPFCTVEPDCGAGACVSACGDGIVLGQEECDDGNTRNGDGCSAACTRELGFGCIQPDLPAQLQIPFVVRDFAGTDPIPAISGSPSDYATPNHVDFELVGDEPSGIEDGALHGNPAALTARIVRSGQGGTATGRGLDLGRPGETFEIHHLDGSPVATVSLAGKPVYAQSRSTCDRTALPADGNDWDKCTVTTMDADSFHTWYVDRDASGNAVTWPRFLGRGSTELERLTLLRGAFDGAGVFTPGGDAYTFDSRYMRVDGTVEATDGLYPIDDLGTTGQSCGSGGLPHDFHFTSEVRFWLKYDPLRTPRLDFSGDDDVWVYVNGHLALDIGGIHGREVGSITIDAANAATWGLSGGGVYEIAVFQAERNQCASNYWLTLEGFNTSRSVCDSECGDGIVASDELCDDGANNQATSPPAYGRCGADCRTRGPSCGDGKVDAGHEQCDDGVNLSVYDTSGNGCAPACARPPRCGDGEIQGPEECDEGTNDSTYGGCTGACQLAPRCGDRRIQADQGEECDDGPSGSGTCSPACRIQEPR